MAWVWDKLDISFLTKGPLKIYNSSVWNSVFFLCVFDPPKILKVKSLLRPHYKWTTTWQGPFPGRLSPSFWDGFSQRDTTSRSVEKKTCAPWKINCSFTSKSPRLKRNIIFQTSFLGFQPFIFHGLTQSAKRCFNLRGAQKNVHQL